MEQRGIGTTSDIRASAGIVSTVLDLAKFDTAMDEDVIVSAQSKAAMYTPARSNSGTRLLYALSANVGETPAPLGITVGRWKVKTNGSRWRSDEVGWAFCPLVGG
jgi:hypothetical protein